MTADVTNQQLGTLYNAKNVAWYAVLSKLRKNILALLCTGCFDVPRRAISALQNL